MFVPEEAQPMNFRSVKNVKEVDGKTRVLTVKMKRINTMRVLYIRVAMSKAVKVIIGLQNVKIVIQREKSKTLLSVGVVGILNDSTAD